MNLYVLLKFVHVVLAIVAVGVAVSYAVWLARAAGERQHLPFALGGVKFLDDRIVNPGFGLLLVFGLAMVFVAQIPLSTFWILAGLILWVVLVVLRLAVLRPSLGRQIQILGEGGAGSPEHLRQISRFRVAGPILGLLSLTIVFLMVVKPGL